MAEAAKNEFEKSKWKHIPEGSKSRCLQKSTKRMRTPASGIETERQRPMRKNEALALCAA